MKRPRCRTTAFLASSLTLFVLLASGSSALEPDKPADLRNQFLSPPNDFRPLVIAHSRPLNREDAIDGIIARRAGGVVMDAGVSPGSKDLNGEPWNNPSYLNDPSCFQRLRETLVRIKQAGLHVWLYDELGYPSGSAGGRVLAGHPEFQVEVVGCRTTNVAPGEAAPIEPGQGVVVACYALPNQDGSLQLNAAVDLTPQARTGPFHWTAPGDGQWSVCLFERFQPDTWRRHNIPRRNVNILDRRAVTRFIELTHTRYAAELGDQLADVDLFFTDEPQFGSAEHWGSGKPNCIPMVQWCDELPIAFRKKKGYDLVEILPALFHHVGPKTGKFRYDFYDTQSDLVADNYFGQLEDWCHAHGLASSGHMLLEESLLFHVMFSGSMAKNWMHQDLPGVDQLGLPRYKTMAGWEGKAGIAVDEDFSIKMAASISTLADKQGVFSESFALCNRTKTPDLTRAAKGMVAWQYACGVTHICTYTLQNALPEDAYAEVADFAGRLALLCRRGRPVSDVAVLAPEAAVWACYNPPNGGRFKRYIACNPEVMQIDGAFREVCHQLLSHQRDFEVLTEQLLAKATVKDGRLELGDQRFAFLILPEARMLSNDALQKIEQFAASGGHVVFIGSLPSMSTARGVDAETRERGKALVESNDGRVRFLNDKSEFAAIVDWMKERVPPPVNWDGPRFVRLSHQREPGRDIFLVANPSPEAAQGKLRCAAAGHASLWNPETGEIEALRERTGRRGVAVSVPADSARFVVFSSGVSD